MMGGKVFYYRLQTFPVKSVGEKILKTGQYFTKLAATIVALFPDTVVYLPTPAWPPAWVGRSVASVCLSVCSFVLARTGKRFALSTPN